MKITDQIIAPDRNIVIITGDKFTPEVSEFLEHLQNRGNYEFFGTGSPETVVTAPIGSTYRRLDGGASTTFYVKESGTGNTGWIAK